MSEVSKVVAAFMGRAMCIVCMADNTGLPPERIYGVLTQLRRFVLTLDGACDGCATMTVVYRFEVA